jgi:23S rRNA pseudouridine955/2504/2580 synthase
MNVSNFNRVQELIIDESSDGQRIDNYLVKILKGVPKTRIYRLLRKGELRVNKGRIKPNYKLKLGDIVRVPPIRVSDPGDVNKPGQNVLDLLTRSIMFEDSRFLILNKPSGIAVHGGSGLSYGVIEGLRALRPDAPYLELAHRIDRETSGILVIAKRRSALRGFQMLMTSNGIDKRYLALVKGSWSGGERKIDLPLLKNTLKSGERVVRVDSEGKKSLSIFRPLEIFTNASLMEVRIISGRTHQVRVHAQASGHPLAGDQKYGDDGFNREMAEKGCKRLFLHASKIRFTLENVMTYDFEAPLENTLVHVLENMKR